MWLIVIKYYWSIDSLNCNNRALGLEFYIGTIMRGRSHKPLYIIYSPSISIFSPGISSQTPSAEILFLSILTLTYTCFVAELKIPFTARAEMIHFHTNTHKISDSPLEFCELFVSTRLDWIALSSFHLNGLSVSENTGDTLSDTSTLK